jgi:histidyl-tRNA synthetase
MKAANRSGAAYAVIVGSDEVESGTVAVRPLRGEGEQVTIARDSLITDLHTRLQGSNQ